MVSFEASRMELALGDGRNAAVPGEELEGTATWRLAEAPERLEVRLFWYTVGKGTQDVGLVDTWPIEPPTPEGEQAFHFRLPAGPYSFSGKLISLVWALELVAEPAGESTRVEIVVAPDAIEVLLGPPPPPPVG